MMFPTNIQARATLALFLVQAFSKSSAMTSITVLLIETEIVYPTYRPYQQDNNMRLYIIYEACDVVVGDL